MTAELVVVACLVVLAVAHSVLGENEILRPLFAAQWTIDVPRWATERILRFAWHLTSIAWLALAGIVAGGDALLLVAIMSLWSAGLVFVMLRGHLAWPLFLLAGLGALRAGDRLNATWTNVGVGATVVVLVAAAGLHVYWAFGGSWMIDRAVPPMVGPDGEPRREPGPGLTLLVAAALAVFAALVVAVADGRGPDQLRWLVGAGVGVLVLRAVGDTKVAGFTKTVRDTPFAEADDRWFTPIVVFLALGATAALLA